MNHTKRHSLFSKCVKPVVFSEKNYELNQVGWLRAGDNITYEKDGFYREVKQKLQYFYTLSFTYKFKYKDDKVFFAQSFPYSYSQLQNFLISLT